MAVPALLDGCENLVLSHKDESRVQTPEIGFLHKVKVCNRLHKLKNEVILHDLDIHVLKEKIQQYRYQ